MDNYPLGAEYTANPWNEEDPQKRKFKVLISQTLSKSCKVNTSDYTEKEDFNDELNQKTIIFDTSETNWVDTYMMEHKTPLDLINALKSILQSDLKIPSLSKNTRLYLIKECKNWIEDELEVIEE